MPGRPSKYTPKIAQLICDLLATGKSLIEICSLESMPTRKTVYQWILRDKAFGDDYARARKMQSEYYFELLTNVAFDETRDVSGELKMPNNVAVNRDKLKVDTLKWILGRMDPPKYGDKLQAEHSGSVGIQLVHSVPQPQREES